VPSLSGTANVTNFDELVTAGTDENVTIINIMNDIVLENTILVDHPVTINGNGHEINFTLGVGRADIKDGMQIISNYVTVNNLKVVCIGDDEEWEGHYGIQCYRSTSVTLNNVTATGEDGGITVNGGNVTMTGTITVTGNMFGGVEVTNGGTLNAAGATFVNVTEAFKKPTLWIDGTGTINGATGMTIATVDGQQQYYLVANNSADTRLSALTTSGVTRTPAFSGATLNYTGTTETGTTTVSATAVDNTATIVFRLGGTIVPAGAVTLVEGSNTLTCTVTKGAASTVYTVTITYTAPEQP
jgi:hypothetical protein